VTKEGGFVGFGQAKIHIHKQTETKTS